MRVLNRPGCKADLADDAFDALLVQTLKKNLEKAFPKMKARNILAELLSIYGRYSVGGEGGRNDGK